MQEGFKVDKALPNKLDYLLKKGSLEKETEILEILKTLSEKIETLENKNVTPKVTENTEEKDVNRIHKKWGSPSF